MNDTPIDWLAHYAAVKARIAAGRPRPPAPPRRAPDPVPELPPRPALPPLPMATPRVILPKPSFSARALRKQRVAEAAARQTMTPEQLADLCDDILANHSISWATLVGHGQAASYIRPRLEVYRRLIDRGWSYSAIARACQRDHTSIMYYIEKWGQYDKA